MSKSKRARPGESVPSGKYAPIPTALIKLVCRQLEGSELRVFLALAEQSLHWNNGTAKLCRSVLKEYNLGSWTTVNSAVRKLIELNVIVCTRKPRPRHCALYGVKYLPLSRKKMAEENARDPAELATEAVASDKRQHEPGTSEGLADVA